MANKTYRENLLQNAKFQMSKIGGKVTVKGRGNDCRVRFSRNDGRTCVVWFPVDGRVRDLDLQDMRDAITEMSGAKPFTMSVSA